MQSHLSASSSDPRRILVRGVNWLGDAVMTVPALMRLRKRFPEAHIALLTPEKLSDLWLHHPAVNEVVTFAPGESVLAAGRMLRARRFDVALVLPNSPRAALEVWLARIPHRIAYARPWRNWFLTRLIQEQSATVAMRKLADVEIKRRIVLPSISQHATRNTEPPSGVHYPAGAHYLHHYIHLAAALGANPEPLPPQLFVTPIELAAVEKKLSLDEKLTGGRPLFALNAGAEYGPAKRWPAERFIAAAQEIQKRTNCVWLITGSEADASLAARIQSALGPQFLAVRNLAGHTSLRELMAVLKLCRMLLTNDTGPMHVAAAVGTPVVAVFGSTSPELTGPGLPGDPAHRLLKSNAPCSPCFRRTCPIDFRCMTGIGVDRVVEAVLDVVSRNRAC